MLFSSFSLYLCVYVYCISICLLLLTPFFYIFIFLWFFYSIKQHLVYLAHFRLLSISFSFPHLFSVPWFMWYSFVFFYIFFFCFLLLHFTGCDDNNWIVMSWFHKIDFIHHIATKRKIECRAAHWTGECAEANEYEQSIGFRSFYPFLCVCLCWYHHIEFTSCERRKNRKWNKQKK